MEPHSVTRMYLMSFYWSFTTTTVGFGDITGATGLEQSFSIIAMGIGGFTFALIVGSIGDLITKAGVAETAYVQMMGELKEFLNSKSVPNDLAVRVITKRLYSNRTVFDEGKIMGRLPSAIRSDLVMHVWLCAAKGADLSNVVTPCSRTSVWNSRRTMPPRVRRSLWKGNPRTRCSSSGLG